MFIYSLGRLCTNVWGPEFHRKKLFSWLLPNKKTQKLKPLVLLQKSALITAKNHATQ